MILQDYLHFLASHSVDYCKISFLGIRVTTTLTLDQMKQLLLKAEEKVGKSIQFFEKEIAKNILDTIEKNKSKFRQDERVTLGQGEDSKEEGFLPFDAKKRPMKYTQMAKMK